MKNIMKKSNFLENPFIILGIFCLLLNPFLISLTFDTSFVIYGLTMIFALILFAMYLQMKGRLNAENAVVLIFFVGIIMRVLFVLKYGHGQMQHDSFWYDDTSGHMAYIQYFFNNNFTLPDFDPRDIWQFYHPPLHHILSALFMKLNSFFYSDAYILAECVQSLTLFYSLSLTVVALKIAKILGLKGKGYVISAAIIIMHPTNMIFAGSVNNDVLCTLLMLCTVYWGIKWYKNSSLTNIIITALFMGFSLLAKTSAVYIAPALAFFFLHKIFKEKENFKKYFIQYAIFAIISIPIGLSWLVRSYVLFDVPMGYIPMLSVESSQYIGSGLNRIFDFSFSQWSNPFLNWETHSDHNIFTSIMKTSMFGEWGNTYNLKVMFGGFLLFFANILLSLLSVFASCKVLVNKNSLLNSTTKMYIVILYSAVMFSFVLFCFVYPFICTMDYRYIAITFIIGATLLGFYVNENKFLQKIIAIATTAFCLFTVMYYSISFI